MASKNLVYISYGEGDHNAEVEFSILSALRHMPPGQDDIGIVLYTDRPDRFAGLRVTIEPLDRDLMTAWAGPRGHNHRRKLAALRDALRRFGAPAAIVDGDTYFTRSPGELFARISPGHSVMHIREGRLRYHWRHYIGVRFEDRSGVTRVLKGGDWMWNGGVVGLDPADSSLMDEILHVNDALFGKGLGTAMQFSSGYVLQHRTSLQETDDIIYHYWHGEIRRAFADELREFMPRFASLHESERIMRCYDRRPRPPLARRARVFVKKLLGYQHPAQLRTSQ